jgi:hypothetical protein
MIINDLVELDASITQKIKKNPPKRLNLTATL